MSRIHEQRRPPQLISSLTFSSFYLGPWDTQWKRVYQRIFVKHAHFFSVCPKSVFGEERRYIAFDTRGNSIPYKSDGDSRRTIQIKGPGIIYRPGVGGGVEDFRGDHSTFGRTKGGISCNWEPKRQDRWKIWKDSEGGPLKFALNP